MTVLWRRLELEKGPVIGGKPSKLHRAIRAGQPTWRRMLTASPTCFAIPSRAWPNHTHWPECPARISIKKLTPGRATQGALVRHPMFDSTQAAMFISERTAQHM